MPTDLCDRLGMKNAALKSEKPRLSPKLSADRAFPIHLPRQVGSQVPEVKEDEALRYGPAAPSCSATWQRFIKRRMFPEDLTMLVAKSHLPGRTAFKGPFVGAPERCAVAQKCLPPGACLVAEAYPGDTHYK